MPATADLYYHLYQGNSEAHRPPVVLIHGAGGTHLYWPTEVRRLPGWRVYAPDLPGHGKSGGRGLQSIAAYSQAVLDWMSALGMHSAIFTGHSMGGAIALSLALDHPELAAGLILIGSGARLKVSPELLEKSASATTYQSAVELVIQWGFSQSSPARLKELAARRMLETRSSVLHADFLACNAFDETARIEKVQPACLLLYGSEDRMTPLRLGQYLEKNMPRAKLTTIPQAGHMVMLEQPIQVAQRMLDFLAGLHF
jgi:pimeloyl-ACP methyl ester carboxylesterase